MTITKFLRVLVFLLLMGGTQSAFCATLVVDCSGGTLPPGVFPTIGSALATLAGAPGPNTISATGTCIEGAGVRVTFARNLIIEGPSGGFVTILNSVSPAQAVVRIANSDGIILRRVAIVGGRGLEIANHSQVSLAAAVVRESTSQGVSVSNNSTLTLGGANADQAVLVQNNSGNGVGVFGSSLLILNGFTTIENNTGGNGISAGSSQVQINGPAAGPNVLRNNFFNGISANSAAVSLTGANLIRDNGQTGILGFDGATVTLTAGSGPGGTFTSTTITANPRNGLSLIFGSRGSLTGPHHVSDNGDSANVFRAGIILSHNSSLRLNGARVSQNRGPGVALDHSSTARLTACTVELNSEQGLRLNAGSSVELDPDPASLACGITGNAQRNVVCDVTSFATGNTGVIPDAHCIRR